MNKAKKTRQSIFAVVAIGVIIIIATILLNNSPASRADSVDKQSSQTNKMTTSQQSSACDEHITKDAYDKIKTGMPYDEVKKIVGSEGKNIFESGDKGTDSYQISYMWIGENGGEATIGFSGKSELKVLMKSQSGLK